MSPSFSGRAKIFSGRANRPLAQKIAQHIGVDLGSIDVNQFSDGETNVEITEHIAGCNVFIIQPTCYPVNDNLIELLIIVDAARRSGVKSITAVVPYYGYARQDRRPGFTRTPITSRLVANMIERSGVDRMIVVDIHSQQQKGFFDIPFHDVSASPEIVADIWRRGFSNLKIISPDVGGVVRARAVAKQLDADIAIVDKRRQKANESEVMHVIGDVDQFDCVIIDDLIDTAGTLCHAATALKERGARSVQAYATHPVFSGNAFANIASSDLDEIVVTDTIPLHGMCEKIRVISMSELLAETIRRIQMKKSISDIYIGLI